MRHPTRVKALRYLNTHGTGSPKDVADDFGLDTSDVAYHMRRLMDLDCIELVKEEQVRGVLRHIYAPIQGHLLEAEHFRELPEDLVWATVGEILEVQADDHHTALNDASLADENVVLIRTPLRGIDLEGQVEIREIMERAYEEIEDVPARCKERRKQSGEPGFLMSAILNAFRVSHF